jgi:GNAT superfamily N-acetyltransferase
LSATTEIVAVTDPRLPELLADGWRVAHRSWAAQLDADRVDRDALVRMVGAATQGGRRTIRPLAGEDVPAVLALDRLTLGDYPGGDATRHPALTPVRAAPGPRRFGSGVFDEGGLLLAITYVDVSADARAETDFTVVRPGHRGRGLGRAVKAASVLALLERRVRVFRTGGAAENTAIIAVNRALGYVRDEEWVTLER